jgi:hypothetical protein
MPSWSDVLSIINLAAVLAVGIYLTSFKKYWEKRAEVQAPKMISTKFSVKPRK